MNGEELTIQTKAGAIFARAWGPHEGVPVLAIHGWLDHGGSFARVAERLDPKLRIVAVDLSGHGRSYQRPPWIPYHLIDWVVEIEDVLDGLKWPTAHLMAHSLGGAIALFFAAIRPERVKRIVLFDSFGPINVEPDGLVARGKGFLEQRKELLKKMRKPQALAALVGARRRSTLELTQSELSNETAELLVRGAFEETPAGWLPLTDPRLRLPAIAPFSLAQILAYLKLVESEVLVFRAKKGILVPSYGWEERKKALKHFTLKEVEGDHYLHLSSPELVAGHVTAFLSDLATISPLV
ncbi:MAG: alpha/beta hydrolase [Deltaproteobacteria bacterium]|nr:alpha/beta hydrolase [Deltaproteobacteria bacterium]MBI3293906.1 alpha/beta hydrolase [Deltaproteobacteria bacterium]